jgi:hypothetical protein
VSIIVVSSGTQEENFEKVSQHSLQSFPVGLQTVRNIEREYATNYATPSAYLIEDGIIKGFGVGTGPILSLLTPALELPERRWFLKAAGIGALVVFGVNTGLASVAQAEDCDMSPNGCGAEGGRKFRGRWFGADFEHRACDPHDICYGTLGASKGDCDAQIRANARQACYEAHPGSDIKSVAIRLACYAIANEYAFQLVLFGGAAYVAGQQKALRCGQQPVTCFSAYPSCGYPYATTTDCGPLICNQVDGSDGRCKSHWRCGDTTEFCKPGNLAIQPIAGVEAHCKCCIDPNGVRHCAQVLRCDRGLVSCGSNDDCRGVFGPGVGAVCQINSCCGDYNGMYWHCAPVCPTSGGVGAQNPQFDSVFPLELDDGVPPSITGDEPPPEDPTAE